MVSRKGTTSTEKGHLPQTTRSIFSMADPSILKPVKEFHPLSLCTTAGMKQASKSTLGIPPSFGHLSIGATKIKIYLRKTGQLKIIKTNSSNVKKLNLLESKKWHMQIHPCGNVLLNSFDNYRIQI